MRTGGNPKRATAGLILPLLLASAAALAQPAATRIGYVDMQRLIDSAPQVLDARAGLEREFAERDRELDREQQRLVKMREQLEGERSLLGAADIERRELEIAALARSIERTREDLQRRFNARVEEELDRAWPAIEAAVAAYAREAGFDLVLPPPVLYASGRVDITDRVLDRLRRDAAEPQP